MANKLQLDETILDEEYKMLKNELTSLDDLYSDAKLRLDKMAKNPVKANPVFMASQTANLISIKEKRLNIIKELTNIKKSKLDIQLKSFNANNKLEEAQSGTSQEVLELFKMLNSKDRDVLKQETLEATTIEDISEPTEEELNKIFETKLNIDVQNKKEKKKQEQILPSEYSIVCTKNKELYIVDSYYNIVDDCEFDTSVINIVRFDTLDEQEVAYDDNNNYYEVVQV